MYTESLLHKAEKVSITTTNASLEQALPPPIYVKGTITDEKGGPLKGATINVKGTSIGTATNANGSFAIEVPEKGGVLYGFTYLVFKIE